MARLFILICLYFIHTSVLADTIVEQVVQTEYDSEKNKATYKWKIADDKFRVSISSDKGEVFYIFNGKVFYACSKFTDKILQEVKNFNIVDKAMIAKIKEGSCQAVPLNSMTQFFLSPIGFISTIDFKDGMQSSLDLSDYKFNKNGQEKIKEIPCEKFERSYILTKQADNKKTLQKNSEKVCLTSQFKWRSIFWKQISRELIRQPKSRGFMKSLNTDLKNAEGFVLESKDEFEKENKTGKSIKGKRILQTIAIKQQVPSESKDYQIPAGFNVVDINSANFLSEDDLKKKNNEIEKDPIPVFFYYILGGVL